MSGGEEWGPWIEHYGGFIPNEIAGALYQVVFDDGDEFIGEAGDEGESLYGMEVTSGYEGWTWKNSYELGLGLDARIIRYRIRKPKGLTILEGVLEPLPEQVDA